MASNVIPLGAVKPVSYAMERWMRMPRLATQTSSGVVNEGDLFVFSGYAAFGDPEPLVGMGTGTGDDVPPYLPEAWAQYDVIRMRVGPHWLRLHGVCPTVVIGGYSQVSPDETADGISSPKYRQCRLSFGSGRQQDRAGGQRYCPRAEKRSDPNSCVSSNGLGQACYADGQ